MWKQNGFDWLSMGMSEGQQEKPLLLKRIRREPKPGVAAVSGRRKETSSQRLGLSGGTITPGLGETIAQG